MLQMTKEREVAATTLYREGRWSHQSVIDGDDDWLTVIGSVSGSVLLVSVSCCGGADSCDASVLVTCILLLLYGGGADGEVDEASFEAEGVCLVSLRRRLPSDEKRFWQTGGRILCSLCWVEFDAKAFPCILKPVSSYI
jgi:hypothetical protein